MENVVGRENRGTNERSIKLLVTMAAAVIIFVLFKSYIKPVNNRYDEEFALVAVLVIVGAVFFGRSIAQYWTYEKMPSWILVLLPLVIIGCLFPCAVFATSLLSHPVFMYALFLAIPTFILCVSLGMFIKLIRLRISWQLREAQTAAANSESELRLLQSQLSPHFLFNTLNNLYGISMSQHEKLPELLLKLSELLRYSVYDTRELVVPLADELHYINNYIDFEKIRIGDRLALITDFENITDCGVKIAPMLLVVFVENAFKHSKNSTDGKIFIDIALKLWNGYVLFSIKNSYGAMQSSPKLEKRGGMGLTNVKKRLELLYPQQYDLSIENDETTYSVVLRLKTK